MWSRPPVISIYKSILPVLAHAALPWSRAKLTGSHHGIGQNTSVDRFSFRGLLTKLYNILLGLLKLLLSIFLAVLTQLCEIGGS